MHTVNGTKINILRRQVTAKSDHHYCEKTTLARTSSMPTLMQGLTQSSSKRYLCGTYDRFSRSITFADNHFLSEEDFLGRYFYTEVPASHHYSVCSGQDLVESAQNNMAGHNRNITPMKSPQ